MRQSFNNYISLLFCLLCSSHFPNQIQAQEEWRVPDLPENVRWKTDGNSVTLWWDPPSTANEILVRGYTISYGIGTPSRRVIIEGANTNAFTINGLKSNTTYVFALTAYNEAEGEDSEKVLFTATTETAKNSEEAVLYLKTPTHVQAKAISSTEIEVHWTDPNVDPYQQQQSLNGVRLSLKRRKYVIQYGEYQSSDSEKITSTATHVVIDKLQPETEYEVAVKVVMPDGMESAWSLRELVRTPSNVASMKWSDSFELRCDFEGSAQCAFHSDPSAPLQWTKIQADGHIKHRTDGGEHFMNLQSTSSDENYGRLLSAPFTFDGDTDYCLSVWIHVRQFSKGTFSVGLLRKVGNHDVGRSLFVGTFERMTKGRWRHLLLDLVVPRGPFQVSFEVRKQSGNEFWVALDDIALHSGRCPDDPGAIPHDDGRLAAVQLIVRRKG